MGNSEGKHKYDVDPVPVEGHPLCVFGRQFVSDKPTLLHMKSKWSWSGDDFSIKNVHTGDTILTIKGQTMSLSDKKRMYDAKGNLVFLMKEKFELNDTQYVYGADEKTELFGVKSNFGNSKQHTEVVTDKGAKATIVSKASWGNAQCAMWIGEPKEGGQPIAGFKSPLELKNFYGKGEWFMEDYYIQIAPGVDQALVCAIVLAMNQMDESYKSSHSW
mmetsp:Transcript_35315/g.69276  ORF Transcript_35315/g.69276 Transcript_35315/m.69276 type:complete len:217 (+) Transcript_35315:36-686(+)|eukprot:CAMPEP_0175143848 /NCGR_PEP_ID=MMETSP0087-20121206/13736_1 /TAXON_ID=136419 /ORGANISM="Unknown Unknown, Strain D1" /LENGTH=216 /DNA_ID=CAMNT_0016428115 /DNA_START=39 /DNA_END=689 /DNA_ORIENTATION=-